MRIVLFNLPFSPNLGDRLIADCMAAELRKIDPALDLVAVDLAGREQPGAGRSKRRLIFALLAPLPGPVRRIVTGFALRRLVEKRLRPRWRALIADADAAVVGGGNLLSDQDLNFPLKVNAALSVAAERGVPTAIHAIGVAPGWSSFGRKLFADGLASVRLSSATVRDRLSQAEWAKQLSALNIAPAGIAFDPALLAVDHFPQSAAPVGAPIGLCITAPRELSYHGSEDPGTNLIEDWYEEVTVELAKRGHSIRFFTTGNPEDEARLLRLAPRLLKAANGRGEVAATPTDPAEFTAIIASCRAIVAHRLHACLTAYSYGIACIGLAWDRKMRGVFELLGYPECMVSASQTSPGSLVNLLENAINNGYDENARINHIEMTRTAIAELLAGLKG